MKKGKEQPEIFNKVFVFAGVFDPVHLGHREVVERALELQSNARVVVVAEKLPQHKHGTTSYQHRHAMLRLAFNDMTGVDVLEAPISEHTIRGFFTWLRSKYPSASFSWIVGSDVISTMSSWPDINVISDEYDVEEIICFKRDDYEAKGISTIGATTVRYLTGMKYSSLSSSQVRQDMNSLNHYVQPQVAGYILKHRLYGFVLK